MNSVLVRLSEARDLLAPFLKLVKTEILPDCAAASFIKTKYYLLLNYSINISFYLMLKAKRLSVSTHPVIKRLAQYRKLINQLESAQGNLLQEIQAILKADTQGKPLYNISNGTRVNVNKAHARKACRFTEVTNYVTKPTSETGYVPSLEPQVGIESENSKLIDNEENLKNDEEEKIADSVVESKGKRAITYQIAKNKGLTPHRKKEQRNPRVKHRNKYRKAKIRRKGAVRIYILILHASLRYFNNHIITNNGISCFAGARS